MVGLSVDDVGSMHLGVELKFPSNFESRRTSAWRTCGWIGKVRGWKLTSPQAFCEVIGGLFHRVLI